MSSQKAGRRPHAQQATRTARARDAGANRTSYGDNRIRTTKYTFLTFAPKNLWEQLHRSANIYFLAISVLTTLPNSPRDPASQIFTFVMVLAFSAVKEAYEDYHRYLMDKQVNATPAQVLRGTGFAVVNWREIVVGDIVRVERDCPFPADMILLSSSDEARGTCHVETGQLDGETNLKPLVARTETKDLQTVEQLGRCQLLLEYELPNASIYTFSGKMAIDSPAEQVPVTVDQILLRGAVLSNTTYAHGVVVFTGHDCKMHQNATDAVVKESSVMKIMDKCLQMMFLVLTIICFLNTLASVSWERQNASKVAYFAGVLDTGIGGVGDYVETFLTFLVVYSNLIPISLYVGVEVLKLTQAYLIDADCLLYHPETNTPACCRTSNLIEELGQVDYIFSDKTGTLTDNLMTFDSCSIGGDVYGRREGGGADDETEVALLYEYRDQALVDKCNGTGIEAAVYSQFWYCVALCQTVIPELPENEDIRQVTYQAASPDEAALVLAAKNVGLIFHSRTLDTITVSNYLGTDRGKEGKEETFEILHVFEFDSTRKRMSVLLRCPDGKVRLYCKGADTIMYQRLRQGPINSETAVHLEQFARGGLRTLCIAVKEIDEAYFEKWNSRLQAASVEVVNRASIMSSLADEIEVDLELLGATAVEDKIQDGVPETILKLRAAGIKLWVLTGDKTETAVNIGHACSLLSQTTEVFEFCDISTANQLLGLIEVALVKQKTTDEAAVVIDGAAIAFALEPEVSQRFLKLAVLCQICICCRVSPKQKALVVQLVRDNFPVITLAIGDGGNDVGMIKAAHVGIGLSGQEGMQAVSASDYSIAQFRFLDRLLLVHGSDGYSRITRFILYYFYKNVVSVMAEFYFASYCGYSGQVWFADLLSLGFNAVFTSYPCCFGFALEKELFSEYLTEFPRLYTARARFGYVHFTFWTVLGFLHAAICFSVPVRILSAPAQDGTVPGLWYLGAASFTAVVLVVTLQMCLMIKSWNTYVKRVTLFSVAFYVSCVCVLTSSSVAQSFQPDFDGIMFVLFGNPSFYFAMVIILAIVTLFDVSAQYCARMLYPTPVDIIVELQMGLDGGLLPCARQNRVHALGHVERAAQAAETETRPVEPVGGSMAPLPGNLASEKKQAVSSAHSLTAGQPPLPPIRQGRGQEGQQ
jgi:phospholipid-transporting ATPase